MRLNSLKLTVTKELMKLIKSAAPLAGLVMALLLPGCGGGGSNIGGGGGLPGSCTVTTYAPNYAVVADLQHWPGFPLRIFFGPTNANTLALTRAGFNQWVTATNGRVSYIEVNSASSADIVVRFDTLSQGDTLGVTTTTFQSGVILEAEIQFYYIPSTSNSANRINQAVAAHEFGHALGLGLHSSVTSDLLYPSTDGNNNVITTRDLNTLLTAYCNTFPQRVTGASRNQPVDNGAPVQKRTISTKRKGD